MSAQRGEQRRENRDHDVHDLLDRPLRTFLHSITPPFCNYLSFLLILTKTLKTPLCVCGLRPLCFSREPASESELSSRSQDNHRFVPNHRPPSAKTPFAPLTEKQPVRRLTPRLLSAGSPLDFCPQVHPLDFLSAGSPLDFLSAGSPLDSCPQAHTLPSCPQAVFERSVVFSAVAV